MKAALNTNIDIRDIEFRNANSRGDYQEQRLGAYRCRFSRKSSLHLDNKDQHSQLFEILFKGEIIGGFRLTPIGSGRSEIEEVFPIHQFVEGSYEFGRLWIRKDLQLNGFGVTAFAKLSEEVKKAGIKIYLKTSRKLGEVTQRHAAIYEEKGALNWRLGYECQLFSVGVH